MPDGKPAIELLAPAGSFSAAIYAFEAGADGVYLGLGEFSARKAAVNFTRAELRRLKTAAAAGGRRIYVAVNTLIGDGETPAVVETLAFLDDVGVDGVIIQDLGLGLILREHFPRLAVHASTQLAVHNAAGVAELKRLGFARVVLAREVPFEGIRGIRAAHPDIELEVFIHGALCYSFSGLCLASGMLLGRSGNRGECAQLCRNYYRLNGEDGYWFSCNDLALEEDVLRLRDLGVAALKIEGRMKAPAYVRQHVALYRALLDGLRPDSPQYRELKRTAGLTFSRQPTRGYFHRPGGEALIGNRYPGHRGVPIGTVTRVGAGVFTFGPERRLERRDGLMFFENDDPMRPVRFAADALTDECGVERGFVTAGRPVTLPVQPLPRRGQTLYQISARSLDLKEVSPERFPLAKRGLAATVCLGVNGAIRAWATVDGRRVEATAEVSVQPARGARDFRNVLAGLFAESDLSLYTVESVAFDNQTGLADDAVFVPPSQLKALKNAFYRRLDEAWAASIAETVGALRAVPVRPGGAPPAPVGLVIPPRQRLSPGHAEGAVAEIPFVGSVAEARRIADSADVDVWLPLEPVCLEPDACLAGIAELVRSRPERRFFIGLNNLHHLALARALADAANAFFFADFLLYVANRHSARFLAMEVPRLAFVYSWIEGGEAGHQALVSALDATLPAARVGDGFSPPLFYSLGCFVRHNRLGKGCDTCMKNYAFELRNGPETFDVRVKDCVTYLFRRRR